MGHIKLYATFKHVLGKLMQQKSSLSHRISGLLDFICLVEYPCEQGICKCNCLRLLLKHETPETDVFL